MHSPETRSGHYCPISKASFILGSKWDLIIVHNLMDGKRRFSELKKIMGGDEVITSSSLSRILKKLENEKIVVRIVDADPTVKVFYELTERGLGLKKVIDELNIWSSKFLYD